MPKVFVIAEAGVNHNGKLSLALKLAKAARYCGADAVKFQVFKAYECTGAFAQRARYQKRNDPGPENQYEMAKRLELGVSAFRSIKAYCGRIGIEFLATPDGEESLGEIVRLGVKRIKVSSTDITNPRLLAAIGRTGKSVLLSTGMSTLAEVGAAIEAVRFGGSGAITLLQCTTEYPAPLVDVNLRAMVTMSSAFGLPVGFSDHTTGVDAAVSAVALGAVVIEKHITLDRGMSGPDHKASMPPAEFRRFVRHIRDTEVLLGDGVKRPSRREQAIARDVRRSIVAKRDIACGERLTEGMLALKRPGWGIRPEFLEIIIGRIPKRNLRQDEPIEWKDI